jgi:outer membrane lipoprotein SlyB
MNLHKRTIATLLVIGSLGVAADALAQHSRVDYGRITAVQQVDQRSQSSRNTGRIVGGALGVASGSGQSGSNGALLGVAGASVGGRVGSSAGSSTAFEYTVLVGGSNTVRIVTEKAGLRVGDCVSVERGQFNNIRLAADDRCRTNTGSAAARQPAPPRSAVQEADACAQATQQLVDAQTDEEFDRAERRMRLLCN